MSVFLNPSNSQPTPSYPPPLSCCQHITTCIKEASYCSLFSTIFSKIVSTWGGENLESFLGYLTIALACLTSALISLILYVLLIPVKLVVAVITLPCCRKTQRTSLLPETPKVVIPLTETQEAFVEEVKQSILQNLTNEFEMNTSEDILSLVPIPSPFLTSLETASCERISCNYKKLIRLINNLNCWDAGWGNIMNYLTVELSEDPSHPDAQTFPIIMHHLILALEDRDISTEKKCAALNEISSYANMCRPTWGETIFRSINHLYNTRNSGRDQILLWLQMFKEHLLTQQQLIAHEEEWHQINGLKHIYGKQLGLTTHHLNQNLAGLTLRQTSTLPQNIEKYRALKNSFEQAYATSYSQLVSYLHNAFVTSTPEIQAHIHNYLLDIVARTINLSETTAHIDVVIDCFYDENYELKPEGIIYLLYVMDIIVPKRT
ncbi:DUF1548 domain-containing protein [Chlamydia psittaci]|uniref:DUF1548 domain-containing protein n=1 Tax=Chlamydia psittaci TaxID=83554 RepID=UPI0002011575|nr:DUF1548 domain-containing protein [Chlamydia psittaci]ADZ18838.1 conserved membrane protein [Chlamydia psittaci 6BC]AEB55814.1 conserved hypothetical protein [Chlamydia psittaci 6BC]ATQ71836.1 uncharacterized protein CHPS25_0817 [Chlamydia psittaci]ATQ72863.1 uncharacterized protein CHPS23_0819 [Chlamydia psittaci]ATQ80107.1 uncharacterized protein CHPS1_0820 [Chlamydia psittaci]